MMTRLGLFLLRLLAALPLPLRRLAGTGFGNLLWMLGHDRRKVATLNLGLCFPEKAVAERAVLARAHFHAFGQSFLDRLWLWSASDAAVRRAISLEGLGHLQALAGRPVILLVPHFVGLDMAWARLALDVDMVTVYANQKNPVFNAALRAGRERFGKPLLLSRQDGMRQVVRHIAAGRPFFYLPDMDFGPRDAVFVPFFGVPAATVTGLSRLARLTGAAVVPVLSEMTPQGYRVRLLPAWEDTPGADPVADTARMNRCIEEWVRANLAQYYWLHKRFKTRPPGEPRFYK